MRAAEDTMLGVRRVINLRTRIFTDKVEVVAIGRGIALNRD